MDKQSSSTVGQALILAVILVTGTALAAAFALLARSAVFVDGVYLPFGVDAFYHARRILDAAAGAELTQFDRMMHVPEGSWVPWPWGFDWFLASLLRLYASLAPGRDAMAFLVHIPVAWLFVNTALLLAILRRLGLRPELCALGVAAFALSPLTQRLHGIGVIDHHFMELTFVMLVTWLTLRWMARPVLPQRALAVGLALGAAQAFHHGLFILQLPVIATIALLWLRGKAPAAQPLAVLAGTLPAVTLLMLLPSGAFRDGQFTMATFSWFHLYVAVASALLIGVMARWPARGATAAGGLLAAALLALPLLSEIWLGSRFVSGTLDMPSTIVEMTSPLAMMTGTWGAGATLGRYSGLLLLAPLLLIGGVWLAWRNTDPAPAAFGVFTVFGIALLLLQYRLNYFGLVFLLAGPLYFIERLASRLAPRRAYVLLGALLVFALAYRPPLAGALFRKPPLAGDHLYRTTQPLYEALRRACDEAPGVVAASAQFGHYIRFHTRCSVIANNFLLTDFQLDKVREANALFHLDTETLARQRPDVRYVLAYLSGVFEQRGGRVFLRPVDDIRSRNPRLIGDLMLNTTTPRRIETLGEVYIDEQSPAPIPLSGLYRIRPD